MKTIIFSFLFIFLGIKSSYAACTSPTGDAGHITYTSSDMKYCDGTNWNTMKVSLKNTSCTSTGAINYSSGDLLFCNGSYWVSMNSGSTDSTCSGTTAGTFTWRNSKMEFCDATNWYIMKPSGSYAAIAHSSSPYVTIYNRSDWSKIPDPATLPTGNGQSVAFSPNGTWLAVGHATSPFLTVYKTADWSTVTLNSAMAAAGSALAWTANSAYLAVGQSSVPRLVIYDTSTWTKITNPSTLPGAAPTALAFNPAGTRLMVAWGGTTFFHILDTTTSPWSTITNPATMPAGTPRGAAFSPDGSLAALTLNGTSNTKKLIVYNTSDWSLNTSVTTTDQYRGAAFNSDGSKLLVTNASTTALTSYNTTTWAASTLQTTGSNPIGVRFSPDYTAYGVVYDGASPYMTVYKTSDDTAYSAPATVPAGAPGYNAISFYP